MDLVEKLLFLVLFLLALPARANPEPETEKPKIRFRFSYSGPLTSPSDPGSSTLHSLPHRSGDLGSLYALMALSPEARAQGIANLCSSLSFERKMELGTSLGFLLSGIYDDSRTGNGPNSNARVSIDDQWSALNRHYLQNDDSARSGVCRDSASTLASFFHECGIPDTAITIDSYISTAGGHQIVSVRSPEGKLYTVNWSELSSQEPQPSQNPLMARPHSLYDQGIQQLRYNWRGQVIGRRDTHLGTLLKQATHGALDDPFYNPSLMSLEAEARGLRLTAFQGRLPDAHRVDGATLGYQRNFGKFAGIEAAGAGALRTGPDGYRSHITYGRFLFFARPELDLKQGLTLSPIILFEGAGALMRVPGESLSPDGHLRITPGIRLEKTLGSRPQGSIAYAEASQAIGIDPYNNNQADRLRPTPFRERLWITGGVVLTNQWDVSLQQRSDIWNRSTTILVQKGSRSQRWNVQGALSIYEIPGQRRFPLLTTGFGRTFDRKHSRIELRTRYQHPMNGAPAVSITLLHTGKG
jgi:hypothetical protein